MQATDKVEIGRTGVHVTRLGLGGVALSGAQPATDPHQTTSEAEAITLIHRSLALGATFNYRAVSAEMMDKARCINAVCERYQVPLKAAALQFILAHPAIVSVIPGARSVAEVEENLRMVACPIPADLWAELQQQGLIAASAPTPGVLG